MTNDMTKDGAPGHAPAVHEEPAGCAPGAAAAPASPALPVSPDVAETSEPAEPPTREDVRRFRLATLRARLALLGVAFDPSTDEATLRRMLRAAEGRRDDAPVIGAPDAPGASGASGAPDAPDAPGTFGVSGAAGATGATDTTDMAGHAADPAPAAPDLPPSAAMRRATARHLRERQRVAAEDIGVTGGTGGRPRGRGRS